MPVNTKASEDSARQEDAVRVIRVFCLNGPIGAGKTTIAERILQSWGLDDTLNVALVQPAQAFGLYLLAKLQTCASPMLGIELLDYPMFKKTYFTNKKKFGREILIDALRYYTGGTPRGYANFTFVACETVIKKYAGHGNLVLILDSIGSSEEFNAFTELMEAEYPGAQIELIGIKDPYGEDKGIKPDSPDREVLARSVSNPIKPFWVVGNSQEGYYLLSSWLDELKENAKQES